MAVFQADLIHEVGGKSAAKLMRSCFVNKIRD